MITLINTENEKWRQERLESVYGWITGTCPQILNRIIQIEDHEGNLGVVWNSPPMNWEKALLQDAWEAQNEATVLHYDLNGDEITQ